jgi:hypothetical protein
MIFFGQLKWYFSLFIAHMKKSHIKLAQLVLLCQVVASAGAGMNTGHDICLTGKMIKVSTGSNQK